MYLFVLLMIYIKTEFSIFLYIYFKNFVWLFLVSAYISQGWFGWKISLKGNLSFIKFYLNLTYEQRNSLITQNFRWEPRLVIMPSYHNGNFAPVDTWTCKSWSWRKSVGLGFSFLSNKTGSHLVPCLQTPLQTPCSTLLIVLLKYCRIIIDPQPTLYNPCSLKAGNSAFLKIYAPRNLSLLDQMLCTVSVWPMIALHGSF